MSKRDLFVVVPDLDAENTMKTLLTQRQEALGIVLDFIPAPPPQGDLLRYSGRDAGCYLDAVELLRPPQRTHNHALICFDRHGSGAVRGSSEDIECEVEENLRRSGWPESSTAAIIIDPELEVWVWADSVEVANALGWNNDMQTLREHLYKKGLWVPEQMKPREPKEAMQESVRAKRKPGGTGPLFAQLAKNVGLRSCQDRSFNKFRAILQQWFPPIVSG